MTRVQFILRNDISRFANNFLQFPPSRLQRSMAIRIRITAMHVNAFIKTPNNLAPSTP